MRWRPASKSLTDCQYGEHRSSDGHPVSLYRILEWDMLTRNETIATEMHIPFKILMHMMIHDPWNA